ncbi:hypothetical protein [uncultured Ramlibacter sp.]|uniref:hypothetical protein n=1 Tax=uncultured Ramlibacter sp. TaxID=260755 RepID=UPI002627CFFC|nr:hypothetical protein [uncultured Ramlibacter sp.]
MSCVLLVQRTIAIAAAVLLAAGPALAEKGGNGNGNGNGKGHDKQGKADKHASHDVKQGAFFNDHDRNVARTYYVQAYPQGKSCPPGLAKKNNGCLPPGQAKKWAMGQPLAHDVVWYSVPQPVLVQLQPVPVGYRYVRVGNDILLLSPQSALVVDVIAGLFG